MKARFHVEITICMINNLFCKRLFSNLRVCKKWIKNEHLRNTDKEQNA